MTQFLTGEIRGGDITKPRVFITGGSSAYKGKTVTCRAGNDLRGTRKVSVILTDDKILGKRFTAFSDKAQAHKPETRESITVKKRPKKPVKGGSLKILFVKREITIGNPNYYDVTWFIGGDRVNPLSILVDAYEDLTQGLFDNHRYKGFNNTGFGDKFTGFLDQILEDAGESGVDGNNSAYTADLLKRRMFKDGIATDYFINLESHYHTDEQYDGFYDGESYYKTLFFNPNYPYFSVFDHSFTEALFQTSNFQSSGDTFIDYVFTGSNTNDEINYVYKNDTLAGEFTFEGYSMNESGGYNIPTERTETYTDRTCLVLPDPDVYLQFPRTTNYSGNYNLYGFNDKKTTSFGLHSEYDELTSTTTTEYRLYNRDLTYKSMPHDVNNPPELLTFDVKNINWVGNKLYVADAWIDDTDDEFYESGSYMGADADSMGGNEPYPKWDTKTPVIIRVYEFKDHPDEEDQFIIEQVDAFLFDAERITPSDYDYTDTGSDGRPPDHPENPLFYYPIALSYHPG
jgi:hypothetical protein